MANVKADGEVPDRRGRRVVELLIGIPRAELHAFVRVH